VQERKEMKEQRIEEKEGTKELELLLKADFRAEGNQEERAFEEGKCEAGEGTGKGERCSGAVTLGECQIEGGV
jgi:hypothetical protein